MTTTTGRTFSFGDATPYGSVSKKHLTAPITALGATSLNRGYWIVGKNGVLHAFGDIPHDGTLKAKPSTSAIVGFATVLG
jgi:hypothetical protein